MIIRYIVEDPDDKDSVLTYHLPHRSREEELFVQLLEDAGIGFMPFEPRRRKQRRPRPTDGDVG